MSGALQDLYHDLVLEHGRRPRNYRRPPEANYHACGDNPLCGDHLELHVRIEAGALRELAFTGEACAIAKAAASLMTLRLAGCELHRGREVLEGFRRLVQPGGDDIGRAAADDALLGELAAFAGVQRFPARRACALLPWEALRRVLQEVQAA